MLRHPALCERSVQKDLIMNRTEPINLMLVEDERVVAFDLKHQLQSFGYRVGATVASGEMAVQRVTELAPDLILMDIHLDGAMDGVEAALEIQRRMPVPIIYLTAFAEDDTLNRALASRPFGYLVKPWDARELHATIQMALARREAEIAVEMSEQRLKLALDAASLGVFEWRPEGNLLRSDGHLGRFFGERSATLDESCPAFLARVHRDDRAKVVAALDRERSLGKGTQIEFRTAPDEKALYFVEANVKAYHTPGEGQRVVGVLRDVTERRLLEDKLHKSSVVFRTAAEAIVIVDHERRVTTVNDAFIRIAGYTEEQASGLDIDVLLRTRRATADGVYFFEELATGQEGYWQGEVECQRSSGERFPAWQSISVVYNTHGKVSNFVIAFSDVSEIHAAEQQLSHLAHHDPLTGLPNRLLFEDRFEQALELARREQHYCLLLFLDLDSFKVVNDTLGHIHGDTLLCIVAERLRNTLRATDTIARLGGDEFVILAGSHNPGYAADLAQKILDVLCEPVPLSGDSITISGSIGIATYPSDGVDRHPLMRAADIAMYSAKAEGRNRYQFYSQDMAERSNQRLHLEQGLRRAIDGGQLTLHFQPQVTLSDRQIVGVEALVRWQHPELGMIPPARFIPIAEESGVIDVLGRWVLEHACLEMAGLKDGLGGQLHLAVNVSAREFMRSDFIDALRETLARTGFPAAALELEITESTLQTIDRSLEILGELKKLGIAVSIDDFGTGYSSLSVLRNLPIDRIKIDRSFIHDLQHNPDGAAIVKAMVALAESLRMDIIVEGIETAEQAVILTRMGCAGGQGYLFSRPIPVADLVKLLATPDGDSG